MPNGGTGAVGHIEGKWKRRYKKRTFAVAHKERASDKFDIVPYEGKEMKKKHAIQQVDTERYKAGQKNPWSRNLDDRFTSKHLVKEVSQFKKLSDKDKRRYDVAGIDTRQEGMRRAPPRKRQKKS